MIDKYKIKELMRKTKYLKGKRLTKKEKLDVLNGYIAINAIYKTFKT